MVAVIRRDGVIGPFADDVDAYRIAPHGAVAMNATAPTGCQGQFFTVPVEVVGQAV
jgi:hypothetical protein